MSSLGIRQLANKGGFFVIQTRQKTILILAGLFSGIIFLASLGMFLAPSALRQEETREQQVVVTQTQEKKTTTATFSYSGEEGKDALSLLKEKTTIEQDPSGLVTAVNGKKADQRSREYWAFYVNGKMATIGPAGYKTIVSDIIEWRMERY